MGVLVEVSIRGFLRPTIGNIGMIWSGERVEARVLEENMTAYFNMLQCFLLLLHGSMVGAEPTLSSCVRASVKQVVDSSFKLMKESISLYGAVNKDWKLSIPQLAGAVWEAYFALKKTPATNVIAISYCNCSLFVMVQFSIC